MGLRWEIQAYISTTGVYLVVRRGVGDWIVIARWTHIIYDGFTTENDAMTFAQGLEQASTIGSPREAEPPEPEPVGLRQLQPVPALAAVPAQGVR